MKGKNGIGRMSHWAQRISKSGITRGSETKVTMFGNVVKRQRYSDRT